MKISGIVLSEFGYKLLPNTTIDLFKGSIENDPKKAIKSVTSDSNGKYAFELPDIEKGTYYLKPRGWIKDPRSIRKIEIPEKAKQKDLTLNIVKFYYPTSNKWGIGFVLFLFLLLLIALWNWYDTHLTWQDNQEKQQLTEFIALAESQIDTNLLSERPGDTSAVFGTIDNLDQLIADLYKEDLNCVQVQIDHPDSLCSYDSNIRMIHMLIQQSRTSTSYGDMQKILNTLNNRVQHLQPELIIWNTPPYLYFEILFWALIGTLIRLLIFNSWYIYIGNFRQYVIPRQVGFLVAVPILALLISMLLSLINFSIAIGDSKIVLDLSEGYIIVLVGALIGFAPWQAWDFMKGFADRFFELLTGWFGKPVASKEATGTPETIDSDSAEPQEENDPDDGDDGNGQEEQPVDENAQDDVVDTDSAEADEQVENQEEGQTESNTDTESDPQR